MAAEAGATATEITSAATLAAFDRKGIETAAGELAGRIAAAVREVWQWGAELGLSPPQSPGGRRGVSPRAQFLGCSPTRSAARPGR